MDTFKLMQLLEEFHNYTVKTNGEYYDKYYSLFEFYKWLKFIKLK